MMKKLLLLALAATILLASVASCSRRNQYEDQLDSQKEAASKDAAMDTGPVRGDGKDDYDVTMEIDTEAETKDVASDTVQDPPAAGPKSPTFYRGGTLLPTGKKYYVNSVAYFYNNLTGNISHWCSDPLCPHDDTCIWSSNLYAKLEYVSDKHIYFIDSEGFLGDEHIATADGTHPTDLGFTYMLEAISPKIKKILKKYGIR